MKEYIVHATTYGGTRFTFCYTNKKKARSFAWQWVNRHKRACRDAGHDEYGELHAYVTVYRGNPFEETAVIAYYN